MQRSQQTTVPHESQCASHISETALLCAYDLHVHDPSGFLNELLKFFIYENQNEQYVVECGLHMLCMLSTVQWERVRRLLTGGAK